MKMLAETCVRFFDLAEAEGRLLKKKVLQTAGALMLMAIAFLLFSAALAMVLAAFFQLVILWWPPPLAYLVTAMFSLILAGGVLWTAHHFNQKQ